MNILVAIAVLAVILVLMAGITSMVSGGEEGARRSNKLMRLRVITQAIAVVIIMVAIWVGGNGPG